MSELSGLTLQHQHKDQWCWAAVTQAVCSFFGNSAATQESIVSQVLNMPECGDSPAPDACNLPFPLEFALQTMQRSFDRVGVLAFAELQRQIDGLRRPVAICLAFAGPLGTTNHYCLIKGCLVVGAAPQVTVLDPAPVSGGESHIAYDDLCSGATLGGAWIDSFTLR